MQTQLLETYIDNFVAFNECPPQLLSFIKGLKALNNDEASMCKFTFKGMFYTTLIPNKYFKGQNITTKCRKWFADMLVKKDITQICVNEFNNILSQVLYGDETKIPYLSTYLFLSNGYNDKCRHTKIKYYSLDNPK